MAERERDSAPFLKLDHGLVVIRYGGVPSIAATLADLAAERCRAVVPLGILDEQTAEAWRRILAKERPVGLEISVPPHLDHFSLDAKIQEVAAAGGGGVEVELFFHKLLPDERQTLETVLPTIASDKLRRATLGPGILEQFGTPAGVLPTADDGAAGKVEEREQPRPAGTENQEATETKTAVRLPVRKRAAPAAEKLAEPASPTMTPTETALTPLPGTSAEGDNEKSSEKTPAHKQAPGRDPYRGLKLGEVLVKMGKLNAEKIAGAVRSARLSGERLGRFLLREGVVSPLVLCRALALQSGLPMTDLSEVRISPDLSAPFSHTLMARLEFVPLDEAKRLLCIAVANPLPDRELQNLERLAGKKIEVFLAQEDLILAQLDHLRKEVKRPERQHRRFEAALPVRWRLCNRLGAAAEKETHHGLTRDISEGGFLVEGTASSVGSPETIRRRGLCARVKLETASQELRALCQIRFIKEESAGVQQTAEGGEVWLYGLEILEMSDADRRRLKETCLQTLERGTDDAPGRRKPFV